MSAALGIFFFFLRQDCKYMQTVLFHFTLYAAILY